ncbi:MAG TPA: hypothetical protein VFD73_06445, partial [Gemmatimonadales bacterium]|nr:hypothetical protein [Gemmatimonadales bacterium]
PVPAHAAGASDGRKLPEAPATARPRTTLNRYLVIIAAGLILLTGAAAATHVFPFSNSDVRILTQNLVQLMPGDLPRNPQDCHTVTPSNPWTMPGLLLELQCTSPELPGTVYAYQLDNPSDSETAWDNFNHWWGFDPASAEKGCPPEGSGNGVDKPTGSELPQAVLPVTECGLQTPSPGKTVPAYAWSWPASKAFAVARTGTGSSFAALHSWSIGQPAHRVGLQEIIPAAIRNQDNQTACPNVSTQFGATAAIQCQHLQGIAAQVIIYYLYPSRTALANGLSALLQTASFRKTRECTSGNSSFTDFLANCQSDYTIETPSLTGSIAEYTNGTQAIIVSTDNEQNVMAVLVGANAGQLLAYWNQQQWIVTGS